MFKVRREISRMPYEGARIIRWDVRYVQDISKQYTRVRVIQVEECAARRKYSRGYYGEGPEYSRMRCRWGRNFQNEARSPDEVRNTQDAILRGRSIQYELGDVSMQYSAGPKNSGGGTRHPIIQDKARNARVEESPCGS